ncbi:MAG: hypothetical protein IAF58_16550 [Leptolyngbya sp.]|nr:hypothetical protein [Candidatus Melainabacteria bacterium]
MENSVQAVEQLAELSQISIEKDIKPVSLKCDSDRIIQVVVNLLTNAIKFSPKLAKITINNEKLENQFVKILITDHGPGIPFHQQAAIFERFKMLEEQSEINKTGSGLGLAICKEIIELHGGQIGVISEPNQGSTFWITLPYDNHQAK